MKNKLLKILCLVAVFLVFVPLLVGCQSTKNTEHDEGYESVVGSKAYDYEFYQDLRSYAIAGYHGKSTIVTLPESYNGLPVTAVADGVFNGDQNLEKLIIPASITSIGVEAFKDCVKLRDLQILGNVTEWGFSAFENCKNLQQIYFATQTKANVKYFYNIETSQYLSGHTTIDATAEDFNNRIFYNAGTLANGISLTIGNSVQLPSNLLRPDQGKNVPKITTINFSNDNTKFYQFTNDTLPYVENIDIPNGIAEIMNNACYSYVRLKSISIPDSVTKIGDNAFAGCENLTTMIIPNSVTSIGAAAFDGCMNLKSVTIPGKFSGNANRFNTCLNLTEIKITDGSTTISESALSNMTNLKSIFIPNTVTSIRQYAFSGCSELTTIYIPKSVTSLGGYVFNDCSNLISIRCGANSRPNGWSYSTGYYGNSGTDTWKGNCKATVTWGCAD